MIFCDFPIWQRSSTQWGRRGNAVLVWQGYKPQTAAIITYSLRKLVLLYMYVSMHMLCCCFTRNFVKCLCSRKANVYVIIDNKDSVFCSLKIWSWPQMAPKTQHRLWMFRENSGGESTHPWGTPTFSVTSLEVCCQFSLTEACLGGGPESTCIKSFQHTCGSLCWTAYMDYRIDHWTKIHEKNPGVSTERF